LVFEILDSLTKRWRENTMSVKSVLEDTKKFLDHLGLSEEPFGVYYDDTKPEKAIGPKNLEHPSHVSWKIRGKLTCRPFSNSFPALSATSGLPGKSIMPPIFPRKNMDVQEAYFTVP
jgi:hypothetical protein